MNGLPSDGVYNPTNRRRANTALGISLIALALSLFSALGMLTDAVADEGLRDGSGAQSQAETFDRQDWREGVTLLESQAQLMAVDSQLSGGVDGSSLTGQVDAIRQNLQAASRNAGEESRAWFGNLDESLARLSDQLADGSQEARDTLTGVIGQIRQQVRQ